MNFNRSCTMYGLLPAAMLSLTVLAATGIPTNEDQHSFTYLGQLSQKGIPYSGSADVTFTLWDARQGGSTISATQRMKNITIKDGNSNNNNRLNNGNENIQLTAPDWFINAPNSIYLNIDSDNNSTNAVLEIAKHRTRDTGGVSLFKVQEDGKVGIATTTPIAPLEVHNLNTGEILRLQSDRTYGYMRFREGSTSRAILGFGDDGGLLVNAIPDSFAIDGMSTALHFAVDSDATKGITIDTDGKVGIGTTAPLARLDVQTMGSIAISGDSLFSIGVNGWASNSSGTNYGVYGGSNSTSGYDFYAAGVGQNYGSSSSIRWKNNVRNIDQPLEKIALLRGVYFDWDKDHGGHHDVGMIAEEVGEVLPEIVNYEENGIDAIGMDYSKMTPLLVEAVNALRAEKNSEIKSLRAANDELRAEKDTEIAYLKFRLEQLEAMMTQILGNK